MKIYINQKALHNQKVIFDMYNHKIDFLLQNYHEEQLKYLLVFFFWEEIYFGLLLMFQYHYSYILILINVKFEKYHFSSKLLKKILFVTWER